MGSAGATLSARTYRRRASTSSFRQRSFKWRPPGFTHWSGMGEPARQISIFFNLLPQIQQVGKRWKASQKILESLAQHLEGKGMINLEECFIDGTFVVAKKRAQKWERPSDCYSFGISKNKASTIYYDTAFYFCLI